MADAESRAVVVGEFVRLVLDFRLIAVALTLVWMQTEVRASTTAHVLVLTVGLVSFAALMRWSRVGRFVTAHPAALAADLVLALVVLQVVGVASPFVHVLLGSALLAGALYGYTGAAVFGLLLVACHEVVALGDGVPGNFLTIVTVPALYPSAAVASAAVARIVVERAEAVERWAGTQARTAVARDLHDTLAKTVQGLRLSTAALESAAASGDRDAVARQAATLRDAASRAEHEARDLMRSWRSSPDGSWRRMLDAVADECAAGSVDLDLDVPARSPDLDATTDRELGLVLTEAVRNVVAHARASRVRIRMVADAGTVRVCVADDGVGWPPQARLGGAADAGHYGLVGMAERVRRLGGTLELGAGPLGGAGLWVELPRAGMRSVPAPSEVAS